jgi:16S rRNA A1518/A1519 N6-dimethyltransferase RsmA/KsgA/DIM1 with predicted DNA glycosylase/AP lyase activity
MKLHHSTLIAVVPFDRYRRLVQEAFSEPRRKVINNLDVLVAKILKLKKSKYGKEVLVELMNQAGISVNATPRSLSVQEFDRLTALLIQRKRDQVNSDG